ncbi:MAG: protoheme IX farnesyltransferase [Chlamydiales bacterium]|nr:protoheme IX farnesyltransferase [Chlamydiales bacterium]
MDALKTYTLLTKPGIILGNVITIAGGFALAATYFAPFLFLCTLCGLSFLIASSCILNNYIDRNLDKLMERTKNRPFALGTISVSKALLLSAALGALGFLFLLATNTLTICIALFGYVSYIILYGFFKRRTHYGTLVGSLAGAVPPVVGYCAMSGRLDIYALSLFALLIVWQMPHFFAIALFRLNDYKQAGLPVHPIQKGIQATKMQMILYVALFMLLGLSLAPQVSRIYLVATLVFSTLWLFTAFKGLKDKETEKWAKKMFLISLWTVTAMFVAMLIPQ